MDYQYIVAAMVVSLQIIASLLGFALWYGSRENRKTRPLASLKFEGQKTMLGIAGSSDIIIVGAGVAGSALAYALAKDGRRVHVIERDLTQPDRIVGQLLQPGGYLKLMELGLEDCANEIDTQQVFGYVLYKDGEHTKLSYRLEKFQSNVAGRSFHNGRFIQKRREKAASLSNAKLEQGTVTKFVEENGTIKGVLYRTKAGQELKAYASLTIVCDGCCSNMRRTLCKPKVEVPSYIVGMTLENHKLPCPNHGHAILADPSPILFYPISSTEIRCLVDVPGQKVLSISNGDMSHCLETMSAPQIPPELHDAFISAVEKGNLPTTTNRTMAASPNKIRGAILVGDAFNTRHPITGGGMTVALSDVVLLRDLLRPLQDLNDAESLSIYLQSFYILRKVPSTRCLMHHHHPIRMEMRQACFDYLKLGGSFSSGPISLLSGLNPHPLGVVFHFFAMAVYAVGLLLLPFPSPQRVWTVIRLIWEASVIILPIMKAEGFRQILFPVTMPSYFKVPPVD